MSTTTQASPPDQREELRANVRGDVLLAATAGDVAAGVRFAARHGMPVAVQTTGHGAAQPADDGALLINTGRLTGVRVDAAARTADVCAGALWSDVLDPAQQHGLAPLMGSSSGVGAVGHTLGGGFGWLGRRHGPASDSVLSFDLVVPDGRVLRASADENPELFWALKGGGGGNLGVVTRMRIRLYPVSEVYAGNLFYPAELATVILRRWRQWAPATSSDLTSAITLMNFSSVPTVPKLLRGNSFVLVRGCWSGEPAEGERVMSFWRDWEAPVLDMFAPMPFAATDAISQDSHDPELSDPVPSCLSSEWFDRLPDAAIEIIVDTAFPLDHAPLLTVTQLRHAGGMVRAGAPAAVNDRGRSGEFLLELLGPPSPELAPVVSAYIQAARVELEPYVNGASCLDFLAGPERQQRTAAAFSPGHRERLAAVKRSLDPDGRFAFGFSLT